ncbi:MAG: glycosyltransferase family 4 protein [Thermoanaerobacteraceae bacterium]|nr:glycosyltransferase family 4 protein [Thermoanaerobacteraceae bacterium]
MAKVVIISHYAPSLINFRGELIKTLVKSGHDVIAFGPEKGFEKEIRVLGAEYRQIPLHRTGTNPLYDVNTLFSIAKLLKEIRPDKVLSYAVKPVIYGSLAAALAGVADIYSMITGLGYLFGGRSTKQKLLSMLIYPLYKKALSKNRVIFFQNPDDLELFKSIKLLSSNQRHIVINGSGVDLDHFQYSPPMTEPVSFLLMARLIWDKGIAEYVSAARNLKKRYSHVSFYLLGPLDSNPNAIKRSDIGGWEDEGFIYYLGETKDVRPYLSKTSVFVLPSFYREGTPRSILEAMSMGRPVITTDAPGCRETVIDGVNGFLVPVKDAAALEKAMEKFILQPELISKYGVESRKIAEEKYDVHKVNKVIIEAMGL